MEILLIILLIVGIFFGLSILGWGAQLFEFIFDILLSGFWGFWGCLIKILIAVFVIWMVISVF